MFEGWPPGARALVERSVAAHGGLECWRRAQRVDLHFVAAAGWLPWVKGYMRTFPAPGVCEIRPHDQTTIFQEYPDIEHRGVFSHGDVRIERAADGVASRSSANHRRTFLGLAKYRQWDSLDALYFFGYAMWHYHTLPFTLADARFLSAGSDSIEVEFSAAIPTHCARQRFFFGDDGRIVRHDYEAEVIGRWARACHFWEDYDRIGGLLLARRRRVAARVFGRPAPVNVLRVDFGRAAVSGSVISPRR